MYLCKAQSLNKKIKNYMHIVLHGARLFPFGLSAIFSCETGRQIMKGFASEGCSGLFIV